MDFTGIIFKEDIVRNVECTGLGVHSVSIHYVLYHGWYFVWVGEIIARMILGGGQGLSGCSRIVIV